MEQMVLPYMNDEHDRERTIDEMPQSAAGKTIMTTEPKFIPKEAAKIRLEDETEVKVRLIDCVGYMVEGASGHMENDAERMVKTPWFDYEVPFTQAAEIGTKKVINESFHDRDCNRGRRNFYGYSERELCGTGRKDRQ